jgi:hypothetical protein
MTKDEIATPAFGGLVMADSFCVLKERLLCQSSVGVAMTVRGAFIKKKLCGFPKGNHSDKNKVVPLFLASPISF